MFKYGKKRPQGATRNLPKGNTPTPTASKSLLPSWLLVGFGLAIGLFLAFMLYLWQPWKPVAKVEATTPTIPSDTPPKDTTDPRFDFYTLLPSQKVITAAPPETPVSPAPAKKESTTPVAKAPKTEKTTDSKTSDKKPVKAVETPTKKDKETDAKKAQAKLDKEKQDKEKQDKEKAAKALTKEKAKTAENNVHYTLQAGSFKSSAEADRRKAAIVLSGLPVRVQKVTVKAGEDWYRVVVGPFAGKEKATQARQNLQSDGVDSLMVKQQKK